MPVLQGLLERCSNFESISLESAEVTWGILYLGYTHFSFATNTGTHARGAQISCSRLEPDDGIL